MAGQLRGDKECPFSGVTKSGRVWRKVPESGARSVGYMLYTESAETAAVSCGTSHVSAVSTPLRWIFKKRAVESHAINTNDNINLLILTAGGYVDIVQELCESRGGRPGLSVLTSLLVSVDVKNY